MISPEFFDLGSKFVILLGWLLVAIGGLKIVFYLVGEIRPATWNKIKSPTVKKMLTGKINRLVFGLGGLITILLGFGSIGIAYVIRHFHGLD